MSQDSAGPVAPEAAPLSEEERLALLDALKVRWRARVCVACAGGYVHAINHFLLSRCAGEVGRHECGVPENHFQENQLLQRNRGCHPTVRVPGRACVRVGVGACVAVWLLGGWWPGGGGVVTATDTWWAWLRSKEDCERQLAQLERDIARLSVKGGLYVVDE